MFSAIPDSARVVFGVIGSAASFGIEHFSTLASIFAAVATGLFMLGCCHEKFLKIWRGRRMESRAPFPLTKDEKK
jgi:hypothetical protein